MGVPVNRHPPTPSSFSLILLNKNVWIQQNGMNRCGTYYPLFSHLDALLCVFMCLVKQGVPSDEDLEWLYPSFLLYEKEF